MTVRSIIEDRMSALSASTDDDLQVRLATSLKRDGSVRTSMLKRLSSSMRFSYRRPRSSELANIRFGRAFRPSTVSTSSRPTAVDLGRTARPSNRSSWCEARHRSLPWPR